MLLTLFVDASVCPKASAWGAWAKMGTWDSAKTYGGAFKELIPNTTDAELCGIINAIATMIRHGYTADVTSMMIQSDSTQALATILNRVPDTTNLPLKDSVALPPIRKSSPLRDAAITHLIQWRIRFGWTFSVRHIRGHSKGSGRNWVNDHCHKIANFHRKKALRERKGKK